MSNAALDRTYIDVGLQSDTGEKRMRGDDLHQDGMFSYISPEQRVPKDHPLRPIRKTVDEILVELSPRFKKLYSNTGRPSIAPEKLLRALLLQILYSVRSERLLVERRPRNKLAETSSSINVIPARGGGQSRVEMHVL